MEPGDFTDQASFYARARPSYPAALVGQLIVRAGVRRGDAVADLGAGTGLFTRLLCGRSLRVTAIEPNAAMREEGLRQVASPDAVWTSGTFAATGLADGSQRWITAAQAFHWADPARALPELYRVLAPGGHLTVLWNDRRVEEHSVVLWTETRFKQLVPEMDQDYRRKKDWAGILTGTGHFAEVVLDEMPWSNRVTARQYVEGQWSSNTMRVAAGPERFQQFSDELEAYLRSEKVEFVDVPYLCRAWTARRAA